jgi:hypothetical protein
MKSLVRLASLAALSGAVMTAAPASAQDDDLDPAAVAAAVRYGLPQAFEGYMTRCFETLDGEGYAVTNAPRLRTKFSDGADAAWPGARQFLMQIAQEEAGQMGDLIGDLDDVELRTFVDGLIESLAAQEIKLESCETIERGLEILDPVPADTVASMFGFLVELGVGMEESEATFTASAPSSSSTPEMTESRERKLREQEDETK